MAAVHRVLQHGLLPGDFAPPRIGPRDGAWSFHGTDETDSLVARCAGTDSLFLVAGRQVITSEGREVLALCCDAELEDGLPLAAGARRCRRRGQGAGRHRCAALGLREVVVRRGNLIARFLRSARLTDIFLEDNGGRIRLAGEPRIFRLAASRGIGILAGSDPFLLVR